MRNLYVFLPVMFFAMQSAAQIINIPDPMLKAKLLAAASGNGIAQDALGNGIAIDINSDNEIQLSEALTVAALSVGQSAISSLDGLGSFANLKKLYCNQNNISDLQGPLAGLQYLEDIECFSNPITSIALSAIPSLKRLLCHECFITSLDAGNHPNLQTLRCNSNSMTALNVLGSVNLTSIWCNDNSLSSIDISGLVNLYDVDISQNQIANIDIADYSNLQIFKCQSNNLTSLNVFGFTALISLQCGGIDFQTLNVGGCQNLYDLYCVFPNDGQPHALNLSDLGLLDTVMTNGVTSINLSGCGSLDTLHITDGTLSALDVSDCPALITLLCQNNQLTSLDLSENINMNTLRCQNNQLETLFIKNGKSEGTFGPTFFDFSGNPGLRYVCCDEAQLTTVRNKFTQYGYTNAFANTYCSFVPGGQYYTVTGKSRWDSEGDGCGASDPIMQNVKYGVTRFGFTDNVVDGGNDDYFIPLQAGTYTIRPVLENPSYFTVAPPEVNVALPAETNPVNQDFCISANGAHTDVEIAIFPLTQARPGSNASYSIIYKNKGTVPLSGNIVVSYNSSVAEFVSASPIVPLQAADTFTWSYSNLAPFESRTIELTLNLNTPAETPPLNSGDFLMFGASIFPLAEDEFPSDNSCSLQQIVQNSLDPNDKTCVEGSIVSQEVIGEYVHYMIRFENTGSATAENVVVRDEIDFTKFDISTIVPLASSHSVTTRITGGSVAEFIFENINLPFDGANNDGYVAFKIKTNPTLTIGDTFSNSASIYFDYNFPIVTNTATTTISQLAVKDFDFDDYFAIYPNPVKDLLTIKSIKQIAITSLSIYNSLGQLVLTDIVNLGSIDVSILKAGNYLIKINSSNGVGNARFIKW